MVIIFIFCVSMYCYFWSGSVLTDFRDLYGEIATIFSFIINSSINQKMIFNKIFTFKIRPPKYDPWHAHVWIVTFVTYEYICKYICATPVSWYSNENGHTLCIPTIFGLKNKGLLFRGEWVDKRLGKREIFKCVDKIILDKFMQSLRTKKYYYAMLALFPDIQQRAYSH